MSQLEYKLNVSGVDYVLPHDVFVRHFGHFETRFEPFNDEYRSYFETALKEQLDATARKNVKPGKKDELTESAIFDLNGKVITKIKLSGSTKGGAGDISHYESDQSTGLHPNFDDF